MSGYIRLISGGAFAAVFMVAILMFAANFANDNDSAVSITDDGRYSALNSTLRTDLDNLKGDAEISQEMLFGTTLESGDEHSATGAQFKIGPFNAVGMAISSFNTAALIVFGSQLNFIFVAFATMLTFILGYYTIKAWLGRSPD